MFVSFYLSLQQGTGTFLDPFRSILNDLIHVDQGEWFDEIDNPARRISLCCVHAVQITHDAIVTDGRSLAIGNPVEEATFHDYLDSLLNTLPNLSVIKNQLELRGISTGWLTANNTIRDGVRYLIRVFTISQLADGENNANIKNLIANNLDLTVAQIPVAIRNGIATWMQLKGLGVSWITGTNTVRDVVQYIVQNLGFGILKMSGQGF